MERDRETNRNLCGRSSRNSREAKARKRSEKGGQNENLRWQKRRRKTTMIRDALCRRKIQQFECFQIHRNSSSQLHFFLPFSIEFIIIGMKTTELCWREFSHNSFRNLEMTEGESY